MDVATITMEPDEAREKLKAVRRRLHVKADAEYLTLEAAYAALEKGTPLVSLTDAIRQGGIGADQRPKLAVARADQHQVRFAWTGSSMVSFRTDSRHKLVMAGRANG